jgi:hypothetical protein
MVDEEKVQRAKGDTRDVQKGSEYWLISDLSSQEVVREQEAQLHRSETP